MARKTSTGLAITPEQQRSWPAGLAGILLLAVGCASDAGPIQEEPPVEEPAAEEMELTAEIDNYQWAVRMRAGDGVSLINEHGDIRARQSGDSGLHYAAVIQKLDGEEREPDFGSDRLPDKLQVEVTVPPDWNGRVDVGARVPPGSPLHFRTTNGLIEVRTGDNDVVASSPDGRFSIRTGGRIEARGETGDMLISMFGTDYGNNDAGHIKTIDGNVELWIQPRANVTLHAVAGGGIDIDTGDSAVVIADSDNNGQWKIGDGVARLDVTTEKGTLVVRMLPNME